MAQGRLPRPSELAPLLRPAPFVRDSTARRLRRAAAVADLRAIARRRTPRAVFDYCDGAADGEQSLRRAREAFDRRSSSARRSCATCRPSTPAATSSADRSALPFVFAPTGFTRMMHTEGERAVASVAQEIGIPYTLSTIGTTIDRGRGGQPQNRPGMWFQLYLIASANLSGTQLVQRAAAAGYDTLMFTVDTPAARRTPARRPQRILDPASAHELRTSSTRALHPHWWFDFLTTEPLEFATLRRPDGTVAQSCTNLVSTRRSTSPTSSSRDIWPGKLVIKGVQNVEDAVRVVRSGADGVLLSNHGGRQLDRAPVPLELVEPPSRRWTVGPRCSWTRVSPMAATSSRP